MREKSIDCISIGGLNSAAWEIGRKIIVEIEDLPLVKSVVI